jgi:hypothetical protein
VHDEQGSTPWSGRDFILLKKGETFDLVRKMPLFEPFIYKNDHFTKTGSIQT